MYPSKFEYRRADGLTDALTFLTEHEDCKILAGGQSLIPMMKLGIMQPAQILDITGIQQLNFIKVDGQGDLRVGALTTHAQLTDSNIIRERCPLLASAADHIGDTQIKDLGTIGGSLSHADPAADYLPALLVLDAKVKLTSLKGSRFVAAEKLVDGPFSTCIDRTEILEEVIIPVYSGLVAIEKFARRKADFAIALVAVILNANRKTITDVRVAVGAIEQGAARLRRLEDNLRGKTLQHEALENEVGDAIKELKPLSDINAGAEYRLDVTRKMITRMIKELCEVAG